MISTRTARHAILGLALGVSLVFPAGATDGLAGPYLAGRAAISDNDFRSASGYVVRALLRDPMNVSIMESALLAYLGTGDVKSAVPIARRLVEVEPGNQFANMLIIAQLMHDKNYEEVISRLETEEGVGPLVDKLLLAWAQVGRGRMAAALETLDEISNMRGTQDFGLYHTALALALVGDLEAADDILAGRNGPTLPASRDGVIAHAEILSQLERNEDALELLEAVFSGVSDPFVDFLKQQLLAGQTLPFATVRQANDGAAEVFSAIGAAVIEDENPALTLVYTRIAEYLRPDHVEAILLSAQTLERLGQYKLATETYDKIPVDSPSYLRATLGRAKALRMAGDTDQAIEVLKGLADVAPDQPDVFADLGDILRRLDRHAEAVEVYDRAIELYDAAGQDNWLLYFTRGISLERSGAWERSEADLRRALELRPDQPQVLNYLGYSLVELQVKLDEALDMIERAVAARPNDGYITDSLGWVLYRLGRYEEAVGHMERATELMPVDPIVNDHLGDVYWAVGRYREARFQWERAMSFEPEEKDATRIRRKLEVGLDRVLEEEGAEPHKKADEG